MKIINIIQYLETIAPPEFQEDYDNSGLITGDTTAECTGVLVSLDCTEEIIREALERKCNLVVSHHPLIFRPIRRLTPENGTGRALISAVRENIAVYAMHTNLDNIISGVNGSIADKIDLINREILLPKTDFPSAGSGLICDLKIPIPESELLMKLKERFMVPVIRHSPLRGIPVSRIGICGGAGSFLIPMALQKGAGFFISGDIKYHEFFGGEGKMVIADIGHFESEQFTVGLIHDVILKKFPTFAVLKSVTVTNPVNYYI